MTERKRKTVGWRRANKTLYLEQPCLRAGDDFNNEAYCSVVAREREIAEIVGDDDLEYEAPFKADKACSGCGYLVCGCERLKAQEQGSAKPKPVSFQVGDVVGFAPRGAVHFTVDWVAPNGRVGLRNGSNVVQCGHGDGNDFDAARLYLVRRAGEPEPERDEVRAKQEPALPPLPASWVVGEYCRAGSVIWRGARYLEDRAEAALPPLPEGFEWRWDDPCDTGPIALQPEEERSVAVGKSGNGRWYVLEWNAEDDEWYDKDGLSSRTTVYDALADALVHHNLMDRGWDIERGGYVFHGIGFFRNGLSSETCRGALLEHEARVLAAERGASRG